MGQQPPLRLDYAGSATPAGQEPHAAVPPDQRGIGLILTIASLVSTLVIIVAAGHGAGFLLQLLLPVAASDPSNVRVLVFFLAIAVAISSNFVCGRTWYRAAGLVGVAALFLSLWLPFASGVVNCTFIPFATACALKAIHVFWATKNMPSRRGPRIPYDPHMARPNK